jgi:hypothetical protein
MLFALQFKEEFGMKLDLNNCTETLSQNVSDKYL